MLEGEAAIVKWNMKRIEYSVLSFYHLPPPQPQPHGRKQQCKRSTSGGTRGLSTATRRGRYGLSAAGFNGGGGGEAEQADLRDELLLQPATRRRRRRRRRRERCVPYCSTTTRAEGQPDATCACMRVVLCRLWVLNVWLLCTHTYTHTSACTLTAAAATACTLGCACM